MKKIFLILMAFATVLIAGCAKDNFEPPKSALTGQVSYKGQVVNLRSNGVQLELWQSGFQLFSKIPVYVSQEGTFSAQLFDGDYKLVRLKGNGPWADNSDTIKVHVAGATTVDVPIDPYFVVSNVAFQRADTTVTATFTVGQVNTTKTLESVRIDLGQTYVTDLNNSLANTSAAGSAVTLNQPVTLKVNIPAAYRTKDYLYARVGIKAAGVSELMYSVSQKVALK